MKRAELDQIINAVDKKIESKVNGKIVIIHDLLEEQNKTMFTFTQKVDEHIERVEPVIKAYEAEKTFNEGVSKVGKRTVFWAQIIAAVGVIVLALKWGITQVLTYKP